MCWLLYRRPALNVNDEVLFNDKAAVQYDEEDVVSSDDGSGKNLDIRSNTGGEMLSKV